MIQDQESKDIILPPEALFQFLCSLLTQSLKLSKNQENDQLVIEEKITQLYIDILIEIRESMKPDVFNERIIDLSTLLFQILKNQASNDNLREKFFEPKNLVTINEYLHFYSLEKLLDSSGQPPANKIFTLYT